MAPSSPIIDIEQAADLTDAVWLDCRFQLSDTDAGRRAWLAGRIPGAQHLDMESDLAGECSGRNGRHPLPDRASLQAALRRAGACEDRPLVAYDDQRLAGSARLWWLLNYFGCDRLRLLNGGFSAWRAAGREIDISAPVAATPGDLTLGDGDPAMLATMAEVADFSANGGAILIDAREPERFAGRHEPIDPVAGRIPGAINKPWLEVSNDDGTLKPAAFQRARWRDIGEDQAVVQYCGSGVTAAVNALSMVVAGRRPGKIYAGSFSEWCADPVNPVARDSDA